MHEFSLCQNLLREASTVARQQYRQKESLILDSNSTSDPLIITGLTVRLGLFCGVDTQLLKRAFNVALHDFHCYWPSHQDNTPESINNHSGSLAPPESNVYFSPATQLILKETIAAIYCRDCDKRYAIDKNQFRQHYLSCPMNDQHMTQMLSGDEMLLINIKMHASTGDPQLDTFLFGRHSQEDNSHV